MLISQQQRLTDPFRTHMLQNSNCHICSKHETRSSTLLLAALTGSTDSDTSQLTDVSALMIFTW